MTAIDWLIDQMFRQGYFDGNKPLSITNLDHLQHQAKEMEKQQMEISDEEIEKGAEENTCYMNDFILGAKWYRERLKAKPWTPKDGKPYDWFNEEYAMEKFKEQLKSK